MMQPVEIVPGVTLGDLKSSYAQQYYELLQHEKIRPFIPQQCVPADSSQAEKELLALHATLSKGLGRYWGIYTLDVLIGTCGLHSYDGRSKTIEISYEVHPHYWNQGIATASVRFALSYATHHFDIYRILCYTLADNIPSQRVATKAGLKMSSFLPRDCYFNGRLVDRILYEQQV